jgi:hypothetical protein
MTAIEGKQRGYLNEWYLCWCLMVLQVGVMKGLFICNLRPKHPASTVDNIEAISEPGKMTNKCAGHRVRKT